jgi:glycine cleavage system H protein
MFLPVLQSFLNRQVSQSENKNKDIGGRIMNFPAELNYTKSHEWVKLIDEKTALAGISDYAQSELGSIVFVNLPEAGDEVTVGEPFADVESVKAVSEIFSPVTGRVVEVNEALADQPELINSDPYEAWLIKVEDITDTAAFLSAAAYEALTHNKED